MIRSDVWIPVRDDRVETPTIDRAAMFVDVLRTMGIPFEGKQVVDLGAGYGSISMALAQCGAEVTAVDAAQDRIDEITRRAAMQRVPLSAYQANLLEAPQRQDAYDLALFVGVVEYAGMWNDTENVESLQVQVLRHAFNALKPGGTVVLSTKNRLWPVFAVRDVHTGKPLLNVLPRSLAERVSRAVWKQPYRRYIHSPGTWSRLLEDAGFVQPQVYTPYFSYQYPVQVVEKPSFGDVANLVPGADATAEELAITRGRFWKLKAAYIAAAATVGLRSSQSVIIRATKP